ncbi:hypothetical protein D3C72_1471610 [compost metagenome]
MIITVAPMATPKGSTDSDLRSGMRAAARIAPTATPTATTACSSAPWDRFRPSDFSAHFSTMNCSVAPTPQNSVVTASEIWPSLSRHSATKQSPNSAISLIGFFSCAG